jgi:hypothetical protein
MIPLSALLSEIAVLSMWMLSLRATRQDDLMMG